MELSHFEKWTLTQSVRTAARRCLRTAQVTTAMSAVTPIADIHDCGWNVRYVPLVTNAPQQIASLFDHLVGAGENRERQMRFNVLRQREFGASPGALFRFRGYGKISSMTQTIVRQ